MILPPVPVSARRSRSVGPRTLVWAAVVAGVLACGGTHGDLDIGNPAPSILGNSGEDRLALIASVEDCISCGFRDTFVAMRALEGAISSTGASLDVALWIVTNDPGDTAAVRQLLTRERLATRLDVVRPASARAVFTRSKIPAVYLIKNQVVVREWEAASGGTIVVARDEFVEALH